MNGRAYYSEIDPAAAAILRELIARNVIAPGDVDDRSIKDVRPGDLDGYTQCHFFAGGGLWSVAARLAGWPDDRPLWTGSCPCQPFSAAGKGLGTDDPRHLWPDFHRLISACRPAVVMGEQVAGAAGYAWFDGVRTDLAVEKYAGRCVDIPACAIDAPHQRNRLYWIAVADAFGERCSEAVGESGNDDPARGQEPDDRPQRAHGADRLQPNSGRELRRSRSVIAQDGEVSSDHHGVVQSDADRGRRSGWSKDAERSPEERALAERIDDRVQPDDDEPEFQGKPSAGQQSLAQPDARPLRNGSWWSDFEWIVSPLDGKARRAKPGIPFLVDGLPGRVDLWRVGGNAIVPILAAEVIASFLETEAIGGAS